MEYYHYDYRKFDKGDKITGSTYTIDTDVAEAYNQATKMEDITSVLYMLDHKDEEYIETYDYEYLVKPIGKTLKVSMDYSVVMCQEDIRRAMRYYIIHNVDTDFDISYIRQTYISLMTDAYMNDTSSKYVLDTLFGYPTSSKVEFICKSAKVL